jgi:regulator of PEP synthase PpsR (kinase-PPPase family)
MKRTVFFVSESTGITAETLGQSLLSQFDNVDFEQVYMPYINTEARAHALTQRMHEAAERDGARPLVFSTMLDAGITAILKQGDCFHLELFEQFVEPLSAELGVSPSRESGRSHADVVLVGVSRSGKTPTCLYLAIHYGLRAANHPLTEDDFEREALPPEVCAVKDKVFGLTIEARRLHLIREERRPGSEYASLARCRNDIRLAHEMLGQLGVPVLDTTSQSIEEISAQVLRGLRNSGRH